MTTPQPEPYIGVGQNYEPGPFDPIAPPPSWGTPPSQTTAVADAASNIVSTTSSVLQQLLGVAGLTVPAQTYNYADYGLPAPGTGSDNFTKAFLTGVDPLQRQQAAQLGQTLPVDPGNDRVYMGHTEKTETSGTPAHIGLPGETDSDLASPGNTETKHKTTTVQAALNMPYLWSDKKQSEVMQKMRAAGYTVTSFTDAFGDPATGSAGVWGQLVARASKTLVLSNGENLVTPWDMLSADKKEAIANGTLDGNGNIVSVNKSTSVNDLTEGQAWDTLRSTMQNMLGRDPTDQEVRDFLSSANADAARDPSHSVTTSTTDVQSGNTSSDTVTHGGYTSADAAQSAYQDLHNDADYGAYQSATTYFNAMLAGLDEVAGSQ